MAQWVNVSSASVNGGLTGSINYDAHGSFWQVEQDERPFLEQAKIDRETLKTDAVNGMRKFATIPDIVAIEINEKYGIDLHDANTMLDTDKMKRFKYIVAKEYAHLLSF